jgi:sensor c-di-GMP phosphodiesterase-like protein
MGAFGVSLRAKKVLAIVAGMLIAGVPMATLNYWIEGFVERQSQNEIDSAARRTIALVDYRIGRAVTMLDDLATRGVASCRADHLDALRAANLGFGAVKEFSILVPDGRLLCSDLGTVHGEREILSTQPVTARPDVTLELLRIGGTTKFVRVRRAAITGDNVLAAMIPADLLVPRTSSRGGLMSVHARMVTQNGAFVSDVGPPSDTSNHLSSTRTSAIYGLTVDSSVSRSVLASDYEDLQTLGLIFTGIVAVALFAFFILFPKRGPHNPVAELEKALKAGEFIPYYQPVVDITTGRVRGAEVLMRWRKPDGTIVAPAAFIPLAESSGLILEMTRAIMRHVRDEMGPAVVERPFLRIGFNLAARHFMDDGIVADVREIFEGSSMRLTQIVLEVTERQSLDSLTSARRVIAALQGLGIKVAIDDIGAGHAGLSYMLKLGVDIIKIDKMFIDALGHETSSMTIVETLIDLARNMRMDVIAEGVETFEQVVALRERGIRAAQGYVFAPPLPGSAFLELLAAIDPQAATAPAGVDRSASLIALGSRASAA